MAELRLRHALRADLPAIADLWVDAFSADAYHRWVVPDDDRYPAYARAWMGFVLGLTFERGHTYLVEPLDAAVAWIPPDVAFVGPDDLARGRAILDEHVGDAKAEECVGMIVAAGSHELAEPHWTLQYLGIRTAAQGRGLGAAIVASGLRRVDDDGLPCGLVSSNGRNVPFYERHGFSVTAEVPTPDGATALRPMARGISTLPS